MRIGRAAGVTDTGRRRLRNEDAFICEPPLFAVADGMGGARAGEVAARLAAAALEEAGAEMHGEEGLVAVISEANRRVWERSVSDPATSGMGTVVTAAIVDAPAGNVVIGHVGDSRAYRLRDGALEQLTSDHSLVAELVESGILTPEEAERHPQRSAITRAVGTEPTVDVDAFTVDAAPGDLYLICSDGLSDMLAGHEVEEVVRANGGDPPRAAEALVVAANARGGEDNITVVLFELLEDAVEVEETAVSAPEPTATEPDAEEAPEDLVEAAAPTGIEASSAGDAEPEASDPSLRRHGAGPGGRIAALLLIGTVLVVGALALYWEFSR